MAILEARAERILPVVNPKCLDFFFQLFVLLNCSFPGLLHSYQLCLQVINILRNLILVWYIEIEYYSMNRSFKFLVVYNLSVFLAVFRNFPQNNPIILIIETLKT